MDSKRKKPVLHEKNGDCCACTVCSVSCPKGAITFKRNTEGFSYPEIDMNKCIGCLRCETVCAFKKDKDSKWDDNNVTVYAAKSKERSVIENSSSGGVFTVLSDYFIENGDAVGSCIMMPVRSRCGLKYMKQNGNVIEREALNIYKRK